MAIMQALVCSPRRVGRAAQPSSLGLGSRATQHNLHQLGLRSSSILPSRLLHVAGMGLYDCMYMAYASRSDDSADL